MERQQRRKGRSAVRHGAHVQRAKDKCEAQEGDGAQQRGAAQQARCQALMLRVDAHHVLHACNTLAGFVFHRSYTLRALILTPRAPLHTRCATSMAW